MTAQSTAAAKSRKRASRTTDPALHESLRDLMATWADVMIDMSHALDRPDRHPDPGLSRDEQRVLLALLRHDGVTSVSNGPHHYADETYSALNDLIKRGHVTAGVMPGLGSCRATFVLTREGRVAANRLLKAS